MAYKRGAREGAMKLPRGKFMGKRVGKPPADEAEHFLK